MLFGTPVNDDEDYGCNTFSPYSLANKMNSYAWFLAMEIASDSQTLHSVKLTFLRYTCRPSSVSLGVEQRCYVGRRLAAGVRTWVTASVSPILREKLLLPAIIGKGVSSPCALAIPMAVPELKHQW
jgi:hypothetical protein